MQRDNGLKSQRGKGVREIPFAHNAFGFNKPTIDTIYEVGGVYGLFRYNPFTYKYECLYVGQSDNLRRRLAEHFNNPPIAGVTHFFAETFVSASQRMQREAQLIREFNPPGNKVGKL
jgi:excinuclease UvrABC nuclease subunit